MSLGRRIDDILPEDRFDAGPLLIRGGTQTIVADVRLDDRAGLARDLCLALARAADLSDAALLAAAWERWNEGALDRLIGEYALIVWDARTRGIVMARDPLGQRPLHFHRSDGFFAAASMPAGLHALNRIPRRADLNRVLGYLALAPEVGPRSFFDGISRVEPGQVVTIDGDRTQTRRYWPPRLAPIRYRRPDDYVDDLRSRFDAAVGAQLRGCGAVVATHLSGGFDSSSVTATAARILGDAGSVAAFTAVPRSGLAEAAPVRQFNDETMLAAATAGMYPNVRHRLITADASALRELDRTACAYERPVPNLCNLPWGDAIGDAARAAGARVLLTGSTGNLSTSWAGHEALSELFAGGRWLRTVGLARDMIKHGSGRKAVAVRLLGPLVPRALWSRLWRAAGPGRDLEAVTLLRASAAARWIGEGNPTNLGMQPLAGTVAARLHGLSWGDRGNYNKGVLATHGLDVRDPTADRRVLEFCLAIPAEQFALNGVPRSLARRAFADRLPAAVLGERRIGYQGADWYAALRADADLLAAEVERIAADPGASALIDIDRMRHLVATMPGSVAEDEACRTLYRSALLRALSAGHFIRSMGGAASR